jgi:hypothetical protein
VKVPWIRKRLPNNPRTDKLPILMEKLSIRLVMKQNLREASHHKRIDDTKQNSSHDGIEQSSNKIATHKKSFTPDEWQ